MTTVKTPDSPAVICWTKELNHCTSKERDIAKAIISKYFDLEYSASHSVGHYVSQVVLVTSDDLDYMAKQRADYLEQVNKTVWLTVLNKLQSNGLIDFTKDKKLGKVLYQPSNKFSTVNQIGEFKPYCFEFSHNNLMSAEINFTVEFYNEES